ncbi:hypothetical protein ACFVXG_40870 [Kitasatospora sp. NPDC058162]|uniref:hypothetical protein n=1 Tax=Kitasatospora sp. NPDC058162 TaxID=3346362 RepID=UPI0036D7B167
MGFGPPRAPGRGPDRRIGLRGSGVVGSAARLGSPIGTEVGSGSGAGSGAAVRRVFGVPARPFVEVLGIGRVDSLVEPLVEALAGLAAGRVEVRAGAVSPGPCARTAGRIRFDRSGRLKTSHGSRLFKGEGPTGEDNAARAAGPPTG